MVKINEFHDMDIPKEIYPKPEYDIKEDLKVYIRNDPMFYRKSFFPAFEDYKKNKKTTVIADMVQNGLKNYCAKFNLPFDPNELLNNEDITTVVSELIKDEMEDLSEGALDWAKKAVDYVRHGSGANEEQFAKYMSFAKRRLQVSDPTLFKMMKKQFPGVIDADLHRAIDQARKEAT